MPWVRPARAISSRSRHCNFLHAFGAHGLLSGTRRAFRAPPLSLVPPRLRWASAWPPFPARAAGTPCGASSGVWPRPPDSAHALVSVSSAPRLTCRHSAARPVTRPPLSRLALASHLRHATPSGQYPCRCSLTSLGSRCRAASLLPRPSPPGTGSAARALPPPIQAAPSGFPTGARRLSSFEQRPPSAPPPFNTRALTRAFWPAASVVVSSVRRLGPPRPSPLRASSAPSRLRIRHVRRAEALRSRCPPPIRAPGVAYDSAVLFSNVPPCGRPAPAPPCSRPCAWEVASFFAADRRSWFGPLRLPRRGPLRGFLAVPRFAVLPPTRGRGRLLRLPGRALPGARFSSLSPRGGGTRALCCFALRCSFSRPSCGVSFAAFGS